MVIFHRYLPLFWLLGFVCIGCQGWQEAATTYQAQKETVHLNRFIDMLFRSAYLWAEETPTVANPAEAGDPYAFFETLRHPSDPWSRLVPDRFAASQQSAGTSTTFGYGLAFGTYSNPPDSLSDAYFAVITFVYAQTAAAQAGLQRGDVIVALNGKPLRDSSLTYLFNAPQLNLTLYDGRHIALTASTVTLNPILATHIEKTPAGNVGYVCYKQFSNKSKPHLDAVFSRFKEEGVTDVVLDLRYNNGGDDGVARYLCSILAPETCLTEQKIVTRYRWNPFIDKVLGTFYNKQVIRKFTPDVPVNMNLNRLYVLTGPNTASASELVISCLMPYMDVTTIGTDTYGKCFGSVMYYYPASDIGTWGVQLISFQYANANLYTGFTDGIPATVPLTEQLLQHVRLLGDPQETLFAHALQLITGESPTQRAQARALQTLVMLPGLHPYNRIADTPTLTADDCPIFLSQE